MTCQQVASRLVRHFRQFLRRICDREIRAAGASLSRPGSGRPSDWRPTVQPSNNAPRTGDQTIRTEPQRRGRRSAGWLALATLAPALAVGLATTVATAPTALAAPAPAAPGGCTTTQQVTTCTF